MVLEMRQDTEIDVIKDQRLENRLSFERKTRQREFIVENLQNIENENGECYKRKIDEDSFVRGKRARYDDSDSDSSSGESSSYRPSLRRAKANCFDEKEYSKSQKEETLMKNENLNIFSDGGKAIIKLTSYCVYDEDMQMRSFDNDAVKDGVILYAAGYAKPIHSENSNITDGIPVKKLGPITQWWITGFDGGEKAFLGLSTDLADYYLMKPSSRYEPYLKEAQYKMFMVKLIIEFLNESAESEATYENLLNKLQITVPPPGFHSVSEEDLLTYADSVYDLVVNYDRGARDRKYENSQCMKNLARLAGFPSQERLSKVRFRKKNDTSWFTRNSELSKAATTNLVGNIFEKFFPEQMDSGFTNNVHSVKKCYVVLRRCDYMCENYQLGVRIKEEKIDRTLCATENLPDFGKRSVASIESANSISTKELKVVLQKTKVESNDDDSSNNCNFGKPFTIVLETWTAEMIDKYIEDSKSCSVKQKKGKYRFRNSRSLEARAQFIGESIFEHQDRYYFGEVMISEQIIRVDDFVTVGEYRDTSYNIGRVIYMWEEEGEKFFHIHWLADNMKTILGEIGCAQELFDTYDCDDLSISMIEDKVDVKYLPIDHTTWMRSGNASFNDWQNSTEARNENSYIYQKLYDCNYGRFEDVKVVIGQENRAPDDCPYCEHARETELLEKPVVIGKAEFVKDTNQFVFESVRWRNEEFRIGSCVFLKSGTLFKVRKGNNDNYTIKDVDEERYPEMYRKIKERKFSRGEEIVNPFDVGYIVSIHSTASSKKPKSTKDVSLTVKKLYRPENTYLLNDLDEHEIKHLDLNLLYWSDEESVVNFEQVEGKCYVANLKNLSCSVDTWTSQGPYRFYYKEAYVSGEKKFKSAPTTFTRSSKCVVSKTKSNSPEKIIAETPKSWPTVSKPLKSLDVFAGCGGLTEGLHQAGVAECHWAIEKEAPAAHAFRLNYPNALVYTEDCNELLKLIMNGQSKKDGQSLPQKGEVELLVGGPPCQGFSRMNRFTDRQYSCFKNSLVVSFLSYVDYFRPRYVVMENVRNFVSFRKHMVLKLTLRCLVKMGYQCTFAVVQAGHFGVSQNRRRAIILAAAPGEILPCYPEPTNSFEENANTLCVDGHKVCTNVHWDMSAPFRKLKVYDAISDLPEIESGGDPSLELSYDGEPKTHFQRLMRKNNDVLRDHVCKTTNPLVEKRITLIPKVPGSDWRDLPNIVVQLPDGSYTRKLVYTHHDVQNGKSKNGRFRGVCCCATGKKCNPKYRQMDTLIPWCLPHTGNRNHHWSGLYGRLEWDGNFKTVITNLDPLAKQGRVIHPDQDRILSARELARSQGFPDKFRFFGTTQDRYRQIGNAVPPPLAAALGREIAKSVAAVEASV